MKIKLLVIGKTEEDYLKKGIAIYEGRIKKYLSFEIIELPALKNNKNLSFQEQKKKEGELILKQLDDSDKLILLDDKGKEMDSIGFSKNIQQLMSSGVKSVVFLVGGPYGFSEEIYSRANGKISLSKLTFSHQMVRLFFTEQLYRAFAIINNEPYHHQ